MVPVQIDGTQYRFPTIGVENIITQVIPLYIEIGVIA
jgi:hypothetical protein